MYEAGYVSVPKSLSANESWQIFPMSSQNEYNIFRPVWRDERLTTPVGGLTHFVMKHFVRGSNQVLIEVGSSPLFRHAVAKTFQRVDTKYTFKQNFVEVEVQSLAEAQTMASLVDLARTVYVPKILNFSFPSVNWYNLYVLLLVNMTEQEKIDSGLEGIEIIGYTTDVPGEKYSMSIQIPIHANASYYEKLIWRWLKEQTLDIKVIEETPRLTEKLRETYLRKITKGLPTDFLQSIIGERPEMVLPRIAAATTATAA
jgi:hypothetical protein